MDERTLTECTVCEGDGYLPEFDDDERDEALGVDTCPECEGLGYVSASAPADVVSGQGET